MAGRDLTAGDLSRRLAEQAERFARELLPNGKREGHEWRAGSIHGEAGKSLGVHLTGEKAGIWSDFATGDSGDLLDLIAAQNGSDIRDACQQAKAMLGIADDTSLIGNGKGYARPKRPKCSTPKSAVRQYLTSRGLSDETLAAYRIGERGDEIVFPFLRDGDLVMAKTRKAADGVAPRPTEANCEPCLFGWQAIPPHAREIIITEGEIDALSVFEMGFPCLSLPYGGGGGNKQQWIEHEYDRLAVYDQIYLCLDNDATGQQAIDEIVKRLGRERIRVVRISAPYKDANDLLTKAKFTKADFAQLLLRADRLDPTELRRAADYADQVLGESSLVDLPGIDLPWPKTHGLFRMRYGETVVLAGYNGQGKTELAGHLTLAAMAQGERCCVASYEFLPHRWLRRLLRQAAAVENPSDEALRQRIDWTQDRLWLVDAKGHERATKTIDVFRYAAKRYGVKFFVIDNLSKCGIADDDYQGQKDFVDRLSEMAREMDVIVLLVMHMAKGDESRPGGKMQARGSGQITDLVDSLLIIWRNKPKEVALANGDEERAKEPDAKLICEKQRNGEHEPRFALWFHAKSHQFIEHPNQFATSYGRSAA